MGGILRFWLIVGLLTTAVEVSYAAAACDAVAGFDYREAKSGFFALKGTGNFGDIGAGMPRGRFVYFVFPRTKSDPAWPVGSEQWQRRTQEWLVSIGAWERVRAYVTPH